MLNRSLRKHTEMSEGHMILEALISTSLTLIAGAGLWKLVTSTRHLVEAGLQQTEAPCMAPECSAVGHKLVCTCGERSYVILR